jgi:plasmid maintenance system antidote protein VapI
MKTIDYLDLLKSKLGITSDYALAKAIGISKQAVSRYYTKGGSFDDDVAVKVAALLGKHPGLVMLDMHRERATNDKTRDLWEEIYSGFRVPPLRAKSVRGHRPHR